jgi:uncharacterized protein YuzE
MKVRYFEDTDTLLIEFRDAPVTETRDLDENTVMDFDAKGNICSITIEQRSAGLEDHSASAEASRGTPRGAQSAGAQPRQVI